jgi:hypothetical protein
VWGRAQRCRPNAGSEYCSIQPKQRQRYLPKVKTAIVLVAAFAAYLYFNSSSERFESPKVVEAVKAGPPPSIVVAPATGARTVTGLKTGPNAQTDLQPSLSLLKTGPNAQTDLNPRFSLLKTGPNAQTDLKPNLSLLKTGPSAQTDLTLKRSW